MRRALGAGGSGIARFFLTESVLLSTPAARSGFGLAWGAVRLLVAFGPATLAAPRGGPPGRRGRCFTLRLPRAGALAFGAIPLLRTAPLVAVAARAADAANGEPWPPPRAPRADGGAGRAGAGAARLVRPDGAQLPEAARDRSRLRSALGAHVPGRIAGARLSRSRARSVAAHHAMLDRLAALPGVTAVSASTCLPLVEPLLRQHAARGRAAVPTSALPPAVSFRAVAGGYFEAMGMRLLRGRGIDRERCRAREPIVVVNQALARRVLSGPGSDRPAHRVERPPHDDRHRG